MKFTGFTRRWLAGLAAASLIAIGVATTQQGLIWAEALAQPIVYESKSAPPVSTAEAERAVSKRQRFVHRISRGVGSRAAVGGDDRDNLESHSLVRERALRGIAIRSAAKIPSKARRSKTCSKTRDSVVRDFV